MKRERTGHQITHESLAISRQGRPHLNAVSVSKIVPLMEKRSCGWSKGTVHDPVIPWHYIHTNPQIIRSTAYPPYHHPASVIRVVQVCRVYPRQYTCTCTSIFVCTVWQHQHSSINIAVSPWQCCHAPNAVTRKGCALSACSDRCNTERVLIDFCGGTGTRLLLTINTFYVTKLRCCVYT